MIHLGATTHKTLVALCAIGLSVLPPIAFAQQSSPLTRDMGIHQKLGAVLPADDTFRDENGRVVKLGDYFGQRPLIVLPIFYQCKSYCALETDSLLQTLLKASHPSGLLGMKQATKDHVLQIGRDMDVLMISIDPTETTELASNKKILIEKAFDDPSVQDHWHLLTGSYKNIKRFTDAVGFDYHWDPKTHVIRHPTCSVIVSPNGTVSSYTIGYEFPTRLLETAVALAAENKHADRPADQTFMFGCLSIDPATGHIRVVVENLMRVGGVLTILVLAFSIFFMLRAERKAGNLGGLSHT